LSDDLADSLPNQVLARYHNLGVLAMHMYFLGLHGGPEAEDAWHVYVQQWLFKEIRYLWNS
jgi:hypothetical protein